MMLFLLLFLILPENLEMFDDIGIIGKLMYYVYRTVIQLCAALFFGYLGFFSRPLIEKYRAHTKFHGIGILGYALIIVIAQYNDPIGMFNNTYGNKLLFVLFALIGIVSTVDISFLLEKNYLLTYFGKNSIIVYATHFVMVELIWAVLSLLFGWKLGDFPGFMIVFVAVMVIEIFVIWFSNKYVPFIFGKKSIQ